MNASRQTQKAAAHAAAVRSGAKDFLAYAAKRREQDLRSTARAAERHQWIDDNAGVVFSQGRTPAHFVD